MKITVIGGGNIGGAIVEGTISKGVVEPEDITVSDPKDTLVKKLEKQGIKVRHTTSNVQGIKDANLVIVAVEPEIGEKVLSELSKTFDPRTQALVSVMRGVTFDELEAALAPRRPGKLSVYRVIPNTAIAFGRSMTFIARRNTSLEHDQMVEKLFWALGHVFRIEESDTTASSALASSGIAYILRYIDSAAKGGEAMGIDRKKAQQIVMMTIKGALALLEASGNSPQEEIDKVTTPGGVTLKGLAEMDKLGFTDAVIKGLLATK